MQAHYSTTVVTDTQLPTHLSLCFSDHYISVCVSSVWHTLLGHPSIISGRVSYYQSACGHVLLEGVI